MFVLSVSCALCLNYSAWNPSLEWQAVFCRSSGRCCSMALPYWAAHTCCRSSPSTCSPYTITTAEVKLHISKHTPLLSSLHNKYCFKVVTWLLFFLYTWIQCHGCGSTTLSVFVRWRGRSAVCFTRAEHCPGSWHVCTFGATLHRAAQRNTCRYTYSNIHSCCSCCGSPFTSNSGTYRVNTRVFIFISWTLTGFSVQSPVGHFTL